MGVGEAFGAAFGVAFFCAAASDGFFESVSVFFSTGFSCAAFFPDVSLADV